MARALYSLDFLRVACSDAGRIPTLSFKLYGTIDLWWLIFLINKPKDIFLARSGESYKYIKPRFIDSVLTNIEQQINA